MNSRPYDLLSTARVDAGPRRPGSRWLVGAALSWICVASACWSHSTTAQEPTAVVAAAPARLVAQLGSPEFAARESAERQLIELDVAARPALIAGLQHTDLEVRRRSRGALGVILERDFRRRVDALRKDPQGTAPIDLPGWTMYRDLVGADKASRSFFADMIVEEPGIFESLEAGAVSALRLRVTEVFYRQMIQDGQPQEAPNRLTLAALILVSSQPKLDGADWLNLWSNLANHMQHGEYVEALKDGPVKEPLRALTEAWLRVPAPAQLENAKLRLAISQGFNDIALAKSLAVLSLTDKRTPNDVASALECVSIVGGKPYALLLQQHLKDERSLQTRILPMNERQELQVRDVALALLIDLTGQELPPYGFTQAKNWFDIIKRQQQNRGNLVFNFGNFFLEKGTDRAASLKKWEQWVAANPLPELPAPPKYVEEFRAQALAQPPQAAPLKKVPAKAAPPALSARGLQIADRELVTALKRVPALLGEQRYAEAAKIVGEILAADDDFCYRPENDSTLFRQVKAQAEQLLSGFPPAALDEYELHYGSIAKAQLEQALNANDLRALADVERRYFFTKVGGEAAFLLGTHHRMQGRFTTGALYFERLRRLSRQADRFEPALSTQLALCWYQAGMSRQAQEAVTRLAKDLTNRAVEIGGRKVMLPAADADLSQWLAGIAGTPARSEPQWSVFAGTPSGNSPLAQGPPWLQGNAWPAPAKHPWLDGLVRGLPVTFAKERRTQLPTTRPLVAGQQVIVRTPTSLVSYDRGTGQIAWESRAVTNLASLLSQADDKERQTRAFSVTAAMRRRLWDDLGFGSLSTDGRYVFALDDFGVRLSNVSKWLRVRDDGQREIDETPFSERTRLVAYDLATGKLVWERGGADDAPDSLAGGRFLGPALPLGDQAFAVVELPDQTLLVALDVETGVVRDQWLLDAMVDEPAAVNNNVWNKLQLDVTSQRAASPSYAEGILVCRTSADRYIAFDLTQRAVRWSFKAPTPEADSRQRVLRRAFGQPKSQPEELRSEEWCDSGAVIADGKVLVTPNDDDKIYCLNAVDGALAWSAPRQDGVYIAGVVDARVVIVGRSGACARRLSDGLPAWTPERVEWPAGASPSGRGYVSRDALHVPLVNAEVVTVSLRDGQLTARARSRQGVVAGNLVQVDNDVYTWSDSGLHRFETLTARAARLPEDAEDLPAEQRLARAEILLNEGKIEPAIEVLRNVRGKTPSAEGDRLLAEALLLASPPQITRLLPLVEEIARGVAEPATRGQLWQRIATAQQLAGQWPEALRACGHWIDSGEPLVQLIDINASRQARRGLVMRTQLESLWNAAPPDQRGALTPLIVERLATATNLDQIDCFGFHPAAQEARLRLARQQFDAGRPLLAELLWREVWRGGDDSQRATAAAALADLLRSTGQVVEAARFYRELNETLADVVCRDGKTGRQLTGELAPGSDVARYLATGDLFSSVKPQVVAATKNEQPAEANTTMIYLPLRPANDGSPLAPTTFVAIDQRNRKLFGHDALGVRRWAVELATPQNANVLGLQNQGFAECRSVGHLMIAWLGSRIFAVDPWTDGGKVLWSRDLMGGDPNRWWRIGQFQRRMQIMAVGGPAPTELGAHFAVNRRYVAFQESRLLTAVDPFTGTTLWMRDDLPPGCELFGDADRLVAIPPDRSEAWILSGTDGRELRRATTAARGQRIMCSGTAWISFGTDGIEAKLERFDLAEGKSTWVRTFAKQAKATVIDDSQLGVLEPSGKFVALAVDDGRLLLETQLDRTEELDSVVVLRNDRDYYVAANRAEPKSDVPIGINRRQPGHVRIDGVMYAIDARTGKRHWQRLIEDQSIVACHPTASPVLVFLHRRQKVTPVGNGGWTSGPPVLHLSCLDRRTGEILHTGEFKNGYDVSFRLQVDPAKREFVFQNTQQLVTITYPP